MKKNYFCLVCTMFLLQGCLRAGGISAFRGTARGDENMGFFLVMLIVIGIVFLIKHLNKDKE